MSSQSVPNRRHFYIQLNEKISAENDATGTKVEGIACGDLTGALQNQCFFMSHVILFGAPDEMR